MIEGTILEPVLKMAREVNPDPGMISRIMVSLHIARLFWQQTGIGLPPGSDRRATFPLEEYQIQPRIELSDDAYVVVGITGDQTAFKLDVVSIEPITLIDRPHRIKQLDDEAWLKL